MSEASFSCTLRGHGLHSGSPSQVRLTRRPGPITLRQGKIEARLEDLIVLRADHGVRVASADGKLEIDLVEHFFAALAGLGVRQGLEVRVLGSEFPFLDAACLRWLEALESLQLPSAEPSLQVLRPGVVDIGGSSYEFTPSDSTRVEVEVDFASRGLEAEQCTWHGDLNSFRKEIAPARSFGFVADYSFLRAAGRAAGAATSEILLFDRTGRQIDHGPRAEAGELARHKLLDLLGDLYLGGGPVRGTLRASCPGHSRNLEAMRTAKSREIVGPAGG